MPAARRSLAEGITTASIPPFLITLPRTSKSQEIIKLTSLCHVAIKAEAYRGQTGLTQCYNCQHFGHVWANCKQPPRCMWCGGGHLHKECPEKGNTASIQICCNCKLGDGEEPQPPNYRGCRHAKEKMRKRKSQRVAITTTGRMFSSSHTTPGLTFAMVLRSNTQLSCVGLPRHSGRNECPHSLETQPQQVPRQTIDAPNANSSSLNDIFKVVATAFKQVTTRLNGAESENTEQ
jgi:hypothetical protein